MRDIRETLDTSKFKRRDHSDASSHLIGETLPIPSMPVANGVAGYPGKSQAPARSDHVHPSKEYVWTELALAPGVTNFGGVWPNASYVRTSEGIVFLRGLVVMPAGRATNAIMTLPSGITMIPSGIHMFTCMAYIGGIETAVRVDIDSGGNVYTSVPLATAIVYLTLSITYYERG